MAETNIKDLKFWRKKHGLSQRKLANLAKINVITLRQVETGKSKPRKDTSKKLQDAIKAIEAKPVAKPPAKKPVTPMIDLKSWRKQFNISQAKLAKLAKVSLNTSCNMEAGKGKPRADTLKKIEQAIKAVEAKPVSKAMPTRKGHGRSRKTTETDPIKLSNVDLELLNRMLNMSGRQKLELLKKMM